MEYYTATEKNVYRHATTWVTAKYAKQKKTYIPFVSGMFRT